MKIGIATRTAIFLWGIVLLPTFRSNAAVASGDSSSVVLKSIHRGLLKQENNPRSMPEMTTVDTNHLLVTSLTPPKKIQGSSSISTKIQPLLMTNSIAMENSDATTDECDFFGNTAAQCISNSNPSCGTCIDSVVEEILATYPDGLSCALFESLVCAGFTGCGCETCESEILDLYECATECPTLFCASPPTESPVTSPVDCDSPLATAAQCISDSNPSCGSCIDAAIDQIIAKYPDGLSCTLFESLICVNITTCECQACESEILDLYECQGGCPTLVCGSPTENQTTTPSPLTAPLPTTDSPVAPTQSPRPPTDPPTVSPTLSPTASAPTCPDELALLKACGQTQGSCLTCISDAYDALFNNRDTLPCADFVVGICSAIAKDCDCGNCGTYAETVSIENRDIAT
jgi:hypothetical protein